MGEKPSPQSKGTLFYVDLPIDNVQLVTSSPNDSKFTIEGDRNTKRGGGEGRKKSWWWLAVLFYSMQVGN